MKSFRFIRVFIALVMFAGVWSVTVVGTRTASSAVVVPSCDLQRFTASSSIDSLPGGTTVRIVMASHYFPKCQWSSSTRYQFLTARSQPIGNAVTFAGAQPTTVNTTLQVVQKVSTMEGVLCNAKVAALLAVIGVNSRRVVRLPTTVGVCVGGTTKWTTVESVSFPVPSRCVASALKVTLGQPEGAAGTIYYPLVFTNIATTGCAISGIPRVQPVTGANVSAAHVPVGPKAALRDFSASGYGQLIRLAPRARASANYGVAESANYPSSRCAPGDFAGVTVLLGGVGHWWVPLKTSTCTKLTSTFVSGVVPTTTGLAPVAL